MTSRKLTALTEIFIPSSGDIVYIVNDPGAAKSYRKITIDNLFLNIPANKLAVGTSQLVVSNGKVGIGIAAPVQLFDLSFNDIRTSGQCYGLYEVHNVNPAIDANTANYMGMQIDIQQAAGNVRHLSSVSGITIQVLDIVDSNGIYGLSILAQSKGISQASKGISSYTYNYGTNGSFVYASEIYALNLSYQGKTASSPLVRGNRVKVENIALDTGSGNATVTGLAGEYININNYGGAVRSAIIGTASILELDLSNGANGTITNSYGIKLNSPVNSGGAGAIANHYGIYIADQTVAGSTLNYALYIAGGDIHLGSTKIGFFGHAPALQPTKAGHNNWANLSDIVQALVDIGILDTV